MKWLFWLGIIGMILFEIANVFFIMPMPGSQEMNSIDLAYFFYKWRWTFRGIFLLMIIIGFTKSRWRRKWPLIFPIIILSAVVYMTNFVMAADHMFYKPKNLLMLGASGNKVDTGRLVLGVNLNGESRAYPIQFLGYHHQVEDTIGGKPIIVTYCTVCRTGRIFEPLVNGKPEKFRLVGMDHYNAMFEDETTRSWWRQVNGQAITGKQKGLYLPEVPSVQTSLAKWLQLNPRSLVMQPDPEYIKSYDSTFAYESGTSRSRLTGTDTSAWKEKSWVVGLRVGHARKAYDWNKLSSERMIHDVVEEIPVLIVMSSDKKSFFAFERPDKNTKFSIMNDTLSDGTQKFRLDGKGIDTKFSLRALPAYQEFWHSWRTFNPDTKQ